ncbi:uncharacterized protein LOC124451781 [Xenia sp. Carnegie-2017]|uniref:uncharacterized protein LOC124451781 n=1 Tax=Xenia sp. Carnegie-2017 TaxID=2897299 RepID=UPI001F0441BC|nr:uncharacterized protein LOC124451781 [Xenia sp. Carnegie-2017]
MMSLMIWWLLWLLFGHGFTMKMGWNEELEFCEEEWKKFVADKIEIDSKCNNTRTRCCVEEKKYLLERFKMFSEICPLEGTCGCSPIILNVTAGSLSGYRYYRYYSYSRYSPFAKGKDPENFTCSHKFINERIEKKLYFISLGIFWVGQHKIPYKYVLYGGKNHTCYVVLNVNVKRQDTKGFFIKDVQSGKCVNDVSWFFLELSWNCFDMRANFKFLQSGSIMTLNTKRCPVRGYGIRLSLFYGNFDGQCRAMNNITQTFWGGLLFSRYNKCIAGNTSLELVSCKNEEDQRFNFGKISDMCWTKYNKCQMS